MEEDLSFGNCCCHYRCAEAFLLLRLCMTSFLGTDTRFISKGSEEPAKAQTNISMILLDEP